MSLNQQFIGKFRLLEPGTSTPFFPIDAEHSDFSLYATKPLKDGVTDPVVCTLVGTLLHGEWSNDWYKYLGSACYGGEVGYNELRVWPTQGAGGDPYLFKFNLAIPEFVSDSNPQPPGGDNGQFGLWNGDGSGSAGFFAWGPTSPIDPVGTGTFITECKEKVRYVCTLVTPGLFVMDQPPPSAGWDFSFCDISGETFSLNTDESPWISFSSANFRDVQASGAIMIGCDFTNCNFTGACWLTGTDFSFAKMTGVVIKAADACGANFNAADLSNSTLGSPFSKAVFSGATLVKAVFSGSDLSSASFDNADLTNADFRNSTIHSCSFRNTILKGANFDKVDLKGADFTGADLSGTILTNTDLTPATFSNPPTFSTSEVSLTNLTGSTVPFNVLGLNWNYLDLTSANITGLPKDLSNLTAESAVLANQSLDGYNLSSSSFVKAVLAGCNLSDSYLMGADFSGAQLQGNSTLEAANFSGAFLQDAVFSSADLSGANFANVFLWSEQVSLEGATLLNTNFSGAYLVGVRFDNIAQQSCEGVIFTNACLIEADFTNTICSLSTTTQPTSFDGACLQGTIFTGAKLTNVSLVDAAVLLSLGPGGAPVSFVVTIQEDWPAKKRTETFKLTNLTTGLSLATSQTTTCPNGDRGPCDAGQLAAPGAPTSWPPPGS